METQKNYKKYLNSTILLSTVTLLQACGGNKNPNYNDPRYYSSYYQNAGGACQIPQGVKDRTVVGDLGNGAILQIDLFSQSPGNTIAAFGQLSTPSVEALFGVNVFTGSFSENPPLTGYGYTGPNSQFTTCVSTNGYSGTLERDGTYQDINLSLVGNGNTFIQMGSSVGVPAFVSGDSLRGSIRLKIGSYPETEFILP